MKNIFYSLLIATSLVATACTSNQEDDVIPVAPGNKTAISFVGQTSTTAITRVGFTGKTPTQIVMHIRSTKDENTNRETRTVANAEIDTDSTATSVSKIGQSAAYIRYWDDAFGRDAKLSVFAIAVPGKTYTDDTFETKLANVSGEKTWDDTSLSEEVIWSVPANQSADGANNDKDLTYSNNIKGDKRLIFRSTETDGPGKFDEGKLEFNHALSRITVNLIKGKGFGDDSFNFADDSNVKFLGAYTSGKLNIETGVWAKDDPTDGVTKMATQSIPEGAKYKFSLMAQVLPDYSFNTGNNTSVLEFIIDDNKYFVTQNMMLAALNGTSGTASSITMEQGKNYVFTITVDKKEIGDITASVVAWKDVEGEYEIDNHHYSFELFDQGSAITDNLLTFYRYQDPNVTGIQTKASTSTSWFGKYTASTAFAYDKDAGKWGTEWFYEDNTKFYHFRTTSTDNVTSTNYSSPDTGGDYFTMSSGEISKEEGKGTDYLWGAPIKAQSSNSVSLTYDPNNGFGSYINPAIGATDAVIRMTQIHMMANIKIVLMTPEQPAASNNSIVLYDENAATKGSTIALTNFYTEGDVNMGNGKITPKELYSKTEGQLITAPSDDNADDFYETTYTKTKEFSYCVVPQALVVDDHKVGLRITTPDRNQYFLVNDLSKIKVKGEENEIVRWNPGHQYIYTITLKKTGIANITCSVVNWKDVEAAGQTITLEN